jgi:signal transduction histidine kinase
MSSMRRFIRTLIVGEDHFIFTHAQYKRVLLTGQLCFITVAICATYMVFDLVNGQSYAWPFQVACSLAAGVSFLLNRNRHFISAKVLLGITVNMTIFIFAASEPFEMGLYMYFITISLGALATFGYEERYLAFSFVLLSTGFFLASLFLRAPIIPIQPFEADFIRNKILVNFLGSGWASVCILYFLMSINHRWETVLARNERELKQKNIDLTNLNADLDRFVYSTSHDLRSPLSSMRGLIHLAQITPDPQEARTLINEMKARIDHLEKFIKDIADFSRNRTQDLSNQTVPVKKLVNEVLDSLRYFPGASEMLVNVEVDENLVVTVDSTRLQIILSNLISNAIKYRDSNKGKSYVIVRLEFNENALVLNVEDNGIGIPKDYLARIFEMYVRAHDQSHGSGLGLFIMKETVTKLGGKIAVESEVSQGSRFTVTIPAVRIADDSMPLAESLPA